MIDLGLLRQNPEDAIRAILTKDPSYDAQQLVQLDQQVRALKQEVEALQQKKNELAQAAKKGVTDELRTQSKQIGAELKEKQAELEKSQNDFNDLYLACPNLAYTDVPVGDKEKNSVVREHGTKPDYNFTIKNHVELAEQLGWLDFSTAAKITGSNFALYKSDAVKLLYATAQCLLKNNIDHGYEPVLPPVLVNEQSLQTSGNFPKFKDQVYAMPDDSLYLSPTSEVGLVNMYRDHIFSADALPVRMTALTSCFRREAGTYGAHERGLIRIHQFEKVELVTLCEPEKSNEELERMLETAESMLKKLDLHYRISLLASQDMSFQAAKTYDIEVWLPGQKQYYEVSSVSNCTDFQARRGLIRYKKAGDKKTRLVNTLNGSSLALPRLMVAMMETYQQPDGSIAIPDVLKHCSLF
jgi:seryl-tRNA synthetase